MKSDAGISVRILLSICENTGVDREWLLAKKYYFSDLGNDIVHCFLQKRTMDSLKNQSGHSCQKKVTLIDNKKVYIYNKCEIIQETLVLWTINGEERQWGVHLREIKNLEDAAIFQRENVCIPDAVS